MIHETTYGRAQISGLTERGASSWVRGVEKMLSGTFIISNNIRGRFEVFAAVTVKNAVIWDDTTCGS
jgi:hypothetical protein